MMGTPMVVGTLRRSPGRRQGQGSLPLWAWTPFLGRGIDDSLHSKGQVNFLFLSPNFLFDLQQDLSWLRHTLEVLVIDRNVWRVEAALGQWIHREVRLFFCEEPTFLNNCIMTSLIPRLSSPAVS